MPHHQRWSHPTFWNSPLCGLARMPPKRSRTQGQNLPQLVVSRPSRPSRYQNDLKGSHPRSTPLNLTSRIWGHCQTPLTGCRIRRWNRLTDASVPCVPFPRGSCSKATRQILSPPTSKSWKPWHGRQLGSRMPRNRSRIREWSPPLSGLRQPWRPCRGRLMAHRTRESSQRWSRWRCSWLFLCAPIGSSRKVSSLPRCQIHPAQIRTSSSAARRRRWSRRSAWAVS
mmetsp:Transcript_84095/g.271124  ORF Transcript_84095/g.271124 Transcript_84095/m.271124 type:complete len:226 (-) Transcript_84095:465-1142(-)